MTRRAPGAEVRLPRRRVANEDGRRFLPRLVVAGGFERVNEGRDVRDLARRQLELRHAAIGPSVLDDRSDQLPVLIVEDDSGSQQARAAVAAARVGAVAERAVDAVERASALDRRGVGGRAIRIYRSEEHTSKLKTHPFIA